MPIYQYACLACGHEVEALQKIHEEPLTTCPECGESALRKKVTAAAFRLKGSGWYETDFKHQRKPGAAADKTVKKPEGDSGAAASGKSESAHSESKAASKSTDGA